jgi:hypothetical protein
VRFSLSRIVFDIVLTFGDRHGLNSASEKFIERLTTSGEARDLFSLDKHLGASDEARLLRTNRVRDRWSNVCMLAHLEISNCLQNLIDLGFSDALDFSERL